MTDLVKLKEEVNKQLASPEILQDLVNTTFKGLQPQMVKRAILEGVMRGFEFKDFLEKNVYAIPFKGNYALVTSIDYARKVGMRSGIVGKSAPQFEEKDDKIISCTVTVKRKVNEYIGDYTATVFFSEFYKPGKPGWPSFWDTKPHVMISKVAEAHALRMACPEELSEMYIAEEYDKGDVLELVDESWREEISAIKDRNELQAYYAKNKGKGKEFDKLIKERLEALQPLDKVMNKEEEPLDKITNDELTDEEKQEIIKQEK